MVTIDNDSQGNSEDISKGSTISMISNGSISQNFNINENQFRLSKDPIPTDENPPINFQSIKVMMMGRIVLT